MKKIISLLAIVLIAGFLYTLTIHGVAGNPKSDAIRGILDTPTKPFELSPERGRFTHVYALAENHTYELDTQLGMVAYPDVGSINSKIYSFFGPGTAYYALPFYELGRDYNLSQVFTFAAISIASIASLVFLYLLATEALGLSIPAALFSVLAYAFGSTAWSYAVTLYQHHLTVFLAVSSLYAAWRFAKSTKLLPSFAWSMYVGFAYAFSLTVDYPNALLLLPIVIYLLVSAVKIVTDRSEYSFSLRSTVFGALLTFVLMTGLHLYHNQYYFDDWSRLAGGLPNYTPAGFGNPASTVLSNDVTVTSSVSADTKNVSRFFQEEKIPRGIEVLFFSLDRGLFVYWPLALFSFLGVFLIWKNMTPLVRTILALVLVNVFLYVSWGDPWGGWAYGPRYLIPSIAWLSLFVGIALTEGPFFLVKKILALVLFAYGVVIAVLGVVTTNAVPPMSEALTLPLQTYGYAFNFEFLKSGYSSVFLFNATLSPHINLITFHFMLTGFVTVLGVILLLLIRPNKKDHVAA